MATVNPLLVRESPSAESPAGGVRRIRLWGPGYPELLAEVAPPPASLYCLGDLSLMAGPAVSIVGSRAATALGRQMAEMLGAALAAEGFVVVSGLARGIDACAHAGALSVDGGTLAVLGGGLDIGVPASTRRLGRRIARDGCLVTEYPAGTPPTRHRFPERNRIVAGLSRLVVIVEAGPRSGALITARLALETGREVMVVPGHPLASNSAGVLRLLHEGARAVRSPADVLGELLPLPGVAEALAARKAALAEREAEGLRAPDPLRLVLETMGKEPEPAEAIAARVGLPVGQTLAALTRLELHGLVRTVPGRRYERRS
ncbi:MAG: DNA-processing protein DprA [Gemmatimonadetes bacterium]|nr:DNA-processing protein DprA [Gemmatimonadota bacterium]